MATDKVETMSAEKIDFAVTTTNEIVSPADIQARFPTLQDLDETQMEALNKKLLRRIDWRLMPMITIMFLRYELQDINHFLTKIVLTLFTVCFSQPDPKEALRFKLSQTVSQSSLQLLF